MSTEFLELLLGPAILISSASFLTFFFGRVVVSNKVRADAERTSVEISGITQLIKYVLSPAVIVALAVSHHDFERHQWGYLIIAWVLISVASLVALRVTKAEEILYQHLRSVFPENTAVEWYIGFLRWSTNIFGHVPPTWPLYLVYLPLAIEIQHKDTLWTAIFVLQAFVLMLTRFFTEAFSMPPKPIPATVHISSGEILGDIELLRVKDNEVQIRKGNTIMILNKNTVSRIEIIDDTSQKYSQEKL